jgi:hypothetical protein
MANTRYIALAHEIGHLAGNTIPGTADWHNPDTTGNYIMTSGGVIGVPPGTRDLLTDGEAKKYDGGP